MVTRPLTRSLVRPTSQIDVYLDATLHPNCIRDPQIFAQEGWHLELEDPSQPLTYKGVVFNEMKGVYSSPDSVNGRVTQNVLFPDTSYAKDSGGDPADIPDLTFDEFKAFYEPTTTRAMPASGSTETTRPMRGCGF